MKLYFYEIKKLCRRPVFIVSFLTALFLPFFIVSNYWWGLTTIQGCFDESNQIRHEKEIACVNAYKQYSGKLTQENYEKIVRGYEKTNENFDYYMSHGYETFGEFGSWLVYDQPIYSMLYNQAEYINNYYDNIRVLISQAESAIEDEQLKESPDKYIIRANESVIEQYNRTRNLQIADNRSTMHFLRLNTIACDGNEFIYIYLLFIAISCAAVFSSEHENKTYGIIYSSPKGRANLFWSKCAAVMSVSAVIALLSELLALGFLAWQSGMGDWNLSLQSLPAYQFCPFDITVGEFVIVIIALRILVFMFAGSVCILVSTFFKRSVAAMFLSGIVNIASAVFVLTVRIYTYAGNLDTIITPYSYWGFDRLNYKLYSAVEHWNVFCLLRPHSYFTEFDTISVFEFPVWGITAVITASILQIVVILTTAGFRYIKPTKKRGSINAA